MLSRFRKVPKIKDFSPVEKQAKNRRQFKIWTKAPIRPWKILLYIEWFIEFYDLHNFCIERVDTGMWTCWVVDKNLQVLGKTTAATIAPAIKGCMLNVLTTYVYPSHTGEELFRIFMKDFWDKLHVTVDSKENSLWRKRKQLPSIKRQKGHKDAPPKRPSNRYKNWVDV